MDISSLMGTLLSAESINSVSKKTGASKAEVKSVLQNALPMLLDGANEQAKGKKTAADFAAALLQHSQNDTSNLPSFFDKLDLGDGAKIIAHLLGGKKDDVAEASGVDSETAQSVLSAAGPLLMSLLGQQTQQEEEKEDGIGGLMGSLLGSVDVGDLVVNMLGGSTASTTSSGKKKKKPKKDDGIDLGDVASIMGSLLK